jgi:hypothetical protein
MLNDFTSNDLLGLSQLFKSAVTNRQPGPGLVQVLVPVEDCQRLAEFLLAESIRRREQS